MSHDSPSDKADSPSAVSAAISSRNKRALQVSLIVLVVLLIGLVCWLTLHLAAPQYLQAREQLRLLEQDNRELALALDQARQQASLLQQEVKVIRQTNRSLQASERDQQQRLAQLTADVRFYQDLLSGTSAPGLAVQSVELAPTETPAIYQYSLTLTQNLQRAEVIGGEARISIEGVENDLPVVLDWSVLKPDNADPLSFEFKYFQQLDGLITMPETFQPRTVRVTLQPLRQDAVIAEIPWQQALLPAWSGAGSGDDS